jgi:nucleotide-binding universal stress UspA family protein
MKNVLLAVNGTKGSEMTVQKFADLLSLCKPKQVVILYVEKYDASFLMDEMAGDSELSELNNALRGTDYQIALDKKAQKVLNGCLDSLKDKGIGSIKTLTKIGHPAEEILKTAKAEKSDLVVVGSRGKRFSPIMMGSVSREVANSADIPVLLIK